MASRTVSGDGGAGRRAALTLFVLLLPWGCTTSYVDGSSSRWEARPRRPAPADAPIEVVARADIARAYKPIGVVQARAPRWEKGPTDDAMLAALKAEARKLGGEALTDLVKNPAEKPAWFGPLPFYGSRLGEVTWAAVVVVWEAEAGSPR